ncbi:MAG: aconitase X [Candidatus Zhuqueibacterota bacterium]
MKLTETEYALLDGRHGRGVKRAMEILVALGRIYGAEDMTPIQSAQISGISYKNIGEPGLEFLRDWADMGVYAHVPAFMNPAGIDRMLWQQLGFPAEFAARQMEIIHQLKRVGIRATLTCTPYHIGLGPKTGEHIAWSESSAVSYANSVLGARTNREGGPSALASAFCGRTPRFGLHLHKNRLATARVQIHCPVKTSADFGLLGYIIGKKIGGGIPFFQGLPLPADDSEQTTCLKSLGAAMAASGAVALFHIENETPEARSYGERIIRETAQDISIHSLDEARNALSREGNELDLVTLGCPHASLDEIASIARRVAERTLRTPLWIATSSIVRGQARSQGLASQIEQAGGRILADTCMVVAPLAEMGIRFIGTNSAKAATYLPSHQGIITHFGTTEQCIESAVEGQWKN